MAKIFLRTLQNTPTKKIWYTREEMDRLRDYLNAQGFYVLHGVDETLDVYTIKEDSLNLTVEVAFLLMLITTWLLIN